jgi:hypothetical protein
MLTAARLVFRSVADLEYDPDAKTPCGLWALNQADEKALDRYEGITSGVYFKSDEITIKYLERPRKALIYLMNSDAIYPPSRAYADTIRQGYRDFGLDERYLDKAIAHSFREKAPDQEIVERRRRQRASREHHELVPMPASVVAELKERNAKDANASS